MTRVWTAGGVIGLLAILAAACGGDPVAPLSGASFPGLPRPHERREEAACSRMAPPNPYWYNSPSLREAPP